MVETYKYKSKIATAISFIAMFIAYLGKDGLTQIMPTEYAWLIPPIIGIAAYIVTQTTENRRVEVAEEMVHEQYQNNDDDPTIPEDEILTEEEDDEEIVGDENESC